ncbi:BTAD domain-containing putative transcriptional regulator [Nonomuraea sp. CA-143628]|uniref:BTAD domain-containing putative transcriptional regulator n=1 Tax=Nonomuraea sp. CA-143628 TaxID=3239997 RepID=UPI003D8CA38E
MRVAILGPLEVESAAISGARLRLLLVRLALSAGRIVTIEELAEALWPDEQPADQANALQSLVSRLRRALPDASALALVPGGYRLDAVTDVGEFDRLTARARGESDPAARAGLLRQALALWRGPALGEVATAPFATGYALRLEEARLTAVEDRAEADLTRFTRHGAGPTQGSATRHRTDQAETPQGTAQGEGADSELGGLLAELGELAARHPLRERLHATHLKALHAAGRRAEALAAYEDVRRTLAAELGADPGPQLREIHLRLLRAEPLRRPRTNLRTPLTSFVGRAAEIAQVSARLGHSRLVTLVGPGGAGKTRLATTIAAALLNQAEHRGRPANGSPCEDRRAGPGAEAAYDNRPASPDGDRPPTPGAEPAYPGPGAVWLVELAPVSDPADVAQAALAALGRSIVPAGPTAPTDTIGHLVEALSAGHVLLVLDNCEHLVEAVARLAEELLGRCPRLRVLATSREPLGIVGEVVSPVPPLPAEPAVRLFGDRVAAACPGLVLDQGLVREVCRRLDGLPLAIELAAARLRALSLHELAVRLDDRFVLLTGGSRTALPRHQTLRAVVAWSWDLLEEPERRLAERLAVFAGGFDLAAAEHLGGTLDLVAALLDKSLLQAADGGRYRMLETIREYGLERLAGSGEIGPARVRHAAYFLRLAELAEPHLRGREQLTWIARLLAEHDNLLAALRFAVDRGDADTAVRLAAAMGIFWTFRGNRQDSVGWMKLALDVPGDAPRQARLIASATFLINGALAGGDATVGAAVEELRRIAELSQQELSHPVLAMLGPALALFTDDKELGPAEVERRLSHPDQWARGMLLTVRAAMKENDGDMRGSRQDLIAAAAQLRAVGERWGLSMALMSLGEAHAMFGDFDDALASILEATALVRQLNPDLDPGHQVWQATIRMRKGEVEQARAELREMTEQPHRDQSPRNAAFAHSALGDLARLEGDLETAAREYERSAATLEYASAIAPQFRALVMIGRAHLALAVGDPAAAGRYIGQAAELSVSARDMPVLARVAVVVAESRAFGGRPVAAARTLGAAEQLRGAPDAFNPEVARLSARLRAELGDGYDAAYAAGRDLDRAAALSLVHAPAAPS